MNRIKLSILIPTYNYKLGINKIIESLKSIDFDLRKNIQIIISDDSKLKIIDKEIEKQLGLLFNNFTYIHNKISLGGPQNWNELISIAEGDYYWLLHHDECWEKEKDIIKYIFKTIEDKKPNIIIFPISIEKNIYINSSKLKITYQHKNLKRIFRHFIRNPKLLLKLNIIGPPSALIYKKNNLMFDKYLVLLVDVEFYIRLLKKFNYKNIIYANKNYNLISSQNNKNSITSKIKRNLKIMQDNENKIIFKKYNFNIKLKERFLLFYSYLILKIYKIFTIRISIK